MKEKGLCIIKQLAESHSEVLLCRLREICLAVTSEVTSLRSKLSCSAIITLGELFALLRKDMDSEVDEVAPVLLHMVWNSPEFVQKAACQALAIMVEKVTPARAMTVLMDKGVKSRYVQVRKCAAELLLSLVQRIGVTKLAGTPRAETLAHVAGTLAQDCHQDTRHYGQEMVKMLLNNPKFKKLLEQSLSTHDLEDILTRIKKKVSAWQKQCLLCASIDTANMRSHIRNTTEELILFGKKWGLEFFEYHKGERERGENGFTSKGKALWALPTLPPVKQLSENRASEDHSVFAKDTTDKVSLMKELGNQWSQLNGEALLAVTECITVLVEWVYARSPEVVERYALPVLWSFLENKALPVRSASVRTVATRLALALYEVMGNKLKKCAASKPPRVQESLSDILG
ncbi:Protein FAM179A [Lonchura striata]|uniref:Protein FAM179A n=1 Tax=Lonchura striata TaxID=40157 RepID=A0A218UVE3_9PASE|nr:Protein FAM179A [Lonchura striata domestica]